MTQTIKIKSYSVADTQKFSAKFAQKLEAGDVVLLEGDLGAGKTCICQAMSEALGCTDTATSPTFTLVQEYGGGRLPVYHVDLYRLESLKDMESLGLDEYFDGGGITLVEWAQRLEEAGWPPPSGCWRLKIHRVSDEERELELVRL